MQYVVIFMFYDKPNMNNIASKTALITESFTKLMNKVTSEKVTIVHPQK